MTDLATRPRGAGGEVAPELEREGQGAGVPAPVPTVAELVDFEASAPTDRRAKATAVRRRFEISTGRYYLWLHHAIETPEALAHAPVAVAALRRELDGRRMRRTLAQIPVTTPASHGSTPTRGPSKRREEHMDGQTGLTFPATGESEKQLGMARADAAADYDWKERVDDAISLLAAGGGEFTADDVRAITGAPPSHPNAMGARFNRAAKVGVIRRVGFRKSGRASLHSHHIALWVGTRPQVLENPAA